MPDATSVVFYIGAHQDDWQLFMSPQAYDDLIDDATKVVFIYTTAGDAGDDSRWGRGRSAGALSSIQYARHLRIETVPAELSEVNGHPIEAYTIANTRSYYLNLPDGNGDGKGFAATGHQGLEKLHQQQIPAIDALVEQSAYATQYSTWQDLVATVRAIVESEAPPSQYASIAVHILDPEACRHSDHLYTGMLVADALGADPRYQQAMYAEYATPDMPINVEGTDLVRKAGLYLFYAQTAFEWSGRLDHLDEWHLSFVPRQYRTR